MESDTVLRTKLVFRSMHCRVHWNQKGQNPMSQTLGVASNSYEIRKEISLGSEVFSFCSIVILCGFSKSNEERFEVGFDGADSLMLAVG